MKTKKIDELIDQKVYTILESEPDETNLKLFYARLNQAKLGMAYKRDRELMKRVSSGQVIRIIGLIAESPEEKKKYILASMPEVKMLTEG